MTFKRMHLIRQVDLFTLRLFLSAVEEQQIGRAAIRENISASTATKRIQDLEEIAGARLLERTPRGVMPSAAGALLARHLRAMFAQLENMRAEIESFTEGVRGEVTIASARSIFAPFLAREIGDFARDHPLVELVVHEVENAEIVQQVARGDADVGVFAAAPGLDLAGLDVVPYRRDRLVAVVPRTHALAARASLRFEDLLPEHIIVVRAMVGAFEVAARRLCHPLNARFQVRSAEVAISLVQAGLGVTVQPECLLGAELSEHVAAVQFDEPWASRLINIATSSGRVSSPAAAALIAQLADRPRLTAGDTDGSATAA